MSKHSLFSPSSSSIWLNCSASIQYLETKKSENVFTLEGVLAHEVLENFLNEMIKCNNKLGHKQDNYKRVKDLLRSSYKNEEMIDYAEGFYNCYRNLFHNSAFEIHVEKRVVHTKDEDLFGTVDLVAYDSEEVHIVDYKYGMTKVEVENNTQLLIYAICTMRMFNLINHNKYFLHIYQPRINNVKTSFISRDVILEKEKEVLYKLGKIKAKERSFRPGDHCKFCPAKMNNLCHSYINYLFNM